MVSAAILLFSVSALVQFWVSYCRTLLGTYEKVELSDQLREVGELPTGEPGASDFGRLMELVHAAPDPGDDGAEMCAISIYYLIASLLSWTMAPISVSVSRWAGVELARCSYFAAVSLDRRLISSR